MKATETIEVGSWDLFVQSISYNKFPKGWSPKGTRCFVLARKLLGFGLRLADFWAMHYAFWIYDSPGILHFGFGDLIDFKENRNKPIGIHERLLHSGSFANGLEHSKDSCFEAQIAFYSNLQDSTGILDQGLLIERHNMMLSQQPPALKSQTVFSELLS